MTIPKLNKFNSVLNFINKYLNQMTSFCSGFDLSECNANMETDSFYTRGTLTSDGSLKDKQGNPVVLHYYIAAYNVNTVLKPFFEEFENKDFYAKYVAMKDGDDLYGAFMQLIGGDPRSNPKLLTTPTDNSFLGMSLSPKNNPEFKLNNSSWAFPAPINHTYTWQEVANSLLYEIQCEAEGYTPGVLSNQKINQVVASLQQYPTLSGIGEVKLDVNVNILVSPILSMMQQYLLSYVKSAVDTMNPDLNSGDDNAEDEVIKNIDETYGEGDFASTMFKVKLQKIVGSSDVSVLGLNSPDLNIHCMDILEEILDDNDFVDTLSTEPTVYDISEDDTGYDICESTEDLEISECPCLTQVLENAVCLSRNLHLLHWLSNGNDMMKLHDLCQELYEELDSEIDTLGELIVERYDTVLDINNVTNNNPVEVRAYTFQEGCKILISQIPEYINSLDLCYVNTTSDVQSVFDEWLRYWSKQVDYFIKRQSES